MLDFYGGHAVALLGYGHPRLVAALDHQARTLFFQSNAVPVEVRERAAERLVGFGPAGLTRAFFVNSGAEANENALRIAFLATRRTRVIAVEGAFHGRTAAAAALTAGSAGWYAFPQTPFPVTFVPFDDADALARAMGPDVAAVILEPVQGVAGARALSPAFLERAREVTRASGALLIFDEVQCGMGRTGSSLRGAGPRDHPRSVDHRQGAGRRLSGGRGAPRRGTRRGRSPRRARHDLRRRSARDGDGDRGHRRDRRRRVAGQRAAALGAAAAKSA